jgi:hypothetical protein
MDSPQAEHWSSEFSQLRAHVRTVNVAGPLIQEDSIPQPLGDGDARAVHARESSMLHRPTPRRSFALPLSSMK